MLSSASFSSVSVSCCKLSSCGTYSRASREDTAGWCGLGGRVCVVGGEGGSNILSSGRGLKKSLTPPFLLFQPGVCGSSDTAGISCLTKKVPPAACDVVVGSSVSESGIGSWSSIVLTTCSIPEMGVVIEIERVPWDSDENVLS